MAIESIQAVRQAEFQAEQIEKDAIQNKDAILSKAQQEANTLITSMSKEAQANAERNMVNAIRKGEETVEAAKRNAEKEILLMKELVKEKEQAAIDLVIANVINDN